jgi:hypothetical protein
LMKPDELRQRRDSGESCSVKLPICHSVLVDMKACDWIGLTWCDAHFQLRMMYLACTIGFELAARIGEYTKKDGFYCSRMEVLLW